MQQRPICSQGANTDPGWAQKIETKQDFRSRGLNGISKLSSRRTPNTECTTQLIYRAISREREGENWEGEE